MMGSAAGESIAGTEGDPVLVERQPHGVSLRGEKLWLAGGGHTTVATGLPS
jgi:hypothetical protein